MSKIFDEIENEFIQFTVWGVFKNKSGFPKLSPKWYTHSKDFEITDLAEQCNVDLSDGKVFVLATSTNYDDIKSLINYCRRRNNKNVVFCYMASKLY